MNAEVSHEGAKARREGIGEGFSTRRLKFAAPIRNERGSLSSADPEYIGLDRIQSWTGRLLEADNDLAEDSSHSDAESTTNRFVKGDVLFGKLRPYLAKAWLADRNGSCTTELLVLQPVEILAAQYLRYWVLQPSVITQIDASTFGAKMPRANWDFIGGLPIPIPPLPAQHRIADYLDRETARIDALVEAKESMLQLLEQKRAALISRAVTRGLDPNAPTKPSGLDWLGDNPEHWRIQRLKQLAEVRGGLTLGKRYTGHLLEFPYLRVANVQDGYLKLNDVATVEVPLSEAQSNLLKDGDVLMNEGGDIDKLGRGCVWRDQIKPCLHQNHVFAVRPHLVDSDWLALWTSTFEAKRYFESRAKRSTNLASISGMNIKEFPILLPPQDEQYAIQAFLDEKQTRFEKICAALQDSIRLLAERRSALITAAVTGQIPLEEMNE